MLGRFTVRPSDDGSNGFGVGDGAVNGWRATGIDDEAKAQEIASDLDVQYDTHGPRPADAGRHVDPESPPPAPPPAAAPRLVAPPQLPQRAAWSAGELDVWIRDNGEWLGRV